MHEHASAPWLRAEVLRVMHKMTAGVPTLTAVEAQAVIAARLSRRDLRFANAVGPDDLALLNALLSVEEALRREEFARLERLLTYCQFSDGPLSDRLLDLPTGAFARAALDLYELGWVDRPHEEW